jgi:hypothetical protein
MNRCQATVTHYLFQSFSPIAATKDISIYFFLGSSFPLFLEKSVFYNGLYLLEQKGAFDRLRFDENTDAA